MNLSDTETTRAFRSELRNFLEEHRVHAPADTTLTYRLNPRPYTKEVLAWQRRLVENGYHHRTVPEEYGGFGAAPDPVLDYIIDTEFLSAGLPQGLSDIGTAMFLPTLLAHGTDDQKAKWARKTLFGEYFWCQGYSEPNSGSDLASLQTRGEVDGDDWVINGQKIWTSAAHMAQMMFCLVRTEPDMPKHHGISYIVIPMDTPGIEVRPIPTMTGHASFNEVFFTDVRVPLENTIGGRGKGWTVANSTLGHERGMMSAAGLSHNRLTRIGESLKRCGHNGALLDRYVALQARVQAMRMHELRISSDPGDALGQLVCKYTSCELNHDLNALAIDLLDQGGLHCEFSDDFGTDHAWHPLQGYDLGMIIGGGTAQIQKNIIAERGLGLPREPKLNKA